MQFISERTKRASQDEFSAIVDELAASGRVINAIALQNGLIDGSISSDAALAELLNVGPVDLAQLETFQKVRVDQFMANLKALDLAGDKNSEKLESMITVLDSWRRMYAKVGDVKDMQLAEEYFAKVDEHHNTVLNNTLQFDTVSKTIDELSSSLSEALSLPDTIPSTGYFNAFSVFTRVFSRIEQFEIYLQTLADWVATLKKFDLLAKNEFPMNSPQCTFIGLLTNYESDGYFVYDVAAQEQEDVVKMINITSAAFSNSAAVDPSFSNTIHLVTSRAAPASTTSRKLTSGFIKGHSDLQSVLQDVESVLIQSLIGGSNPKLLEDGLQPLTSLDGNFVDLEKSWSSLSEAGGVRAARKFADMSRKFETVKLVATAATSVAKVSVCCPKPSGNVDFSKKAGNMITEAVKLRIYLYDVFGKAKSLLESSLLDDLKGMTKIKAFIPITGNTPMNAIPQIHAKFKEFKDVQKYIDLLATLKSVLSDLESEVAKDDANNMIQRMSGGLTTMQDFANHASTIKLIQYFDTVKSVPEIESVAKAVRLIQDVRGLQTDAQFAQNISTAANVIDASLPKLQSLRSMATAIRGNRSPEVMKLAQLSNFEKTAQDYGNSVLALHNVRQILGKKEQLETFVREGDRVEVEIGKVKDSKERSMLEEDWGDFEKTKTEVRGMIGDLETKRNMTTLPKASKFAEYEPVFAEFVNLKDIDLMVAGRRSTLETLRASTQQLNDVESILSDCAPLDLHFSKFGQSLSGIRSTLNNIDLAFAKLFVSVTTSTAASSNNNSSTSSIFSTNEPTSLLPLVILAFSTTSTFISTTSFWTSLGVYVYGVYTAGVIFLVLMLFFTVRLIMYLWQIFKKWWNEPRNKKAVEEYMSQYQNNDKKEKQEKKSTAETKQVQESKGRAAEQVPLLPEQVPLLPEQVPLLPEQREQPADEVISEGSDQQRSKIFGVDNLQRGCDGCLAEHPYRAKDFLMKYGWADYCYENPPYNNDMNLSKEENEAKEHDHNNYHKEKRAEFEKRGMRNNAFEELVKFGFDDTIENKKSTVIKVWYNLHADSFSSHGGITVPYKSRVRDADVKYIERTLPPSFKKEEEKAKWIDANLVIFPLRSGAYVMSAPMAKKGIFDIKKDTRHLFWIFTLDYHVKFIVELRDKTAANEQYDYFGDLNVPRQFGNITVTVVEEKNLCKDGPIKRSIKVEEKGEDGRIVRDRILAHYQVNNWTEKGICVATDLVAIYKEIRPISEEERPYIVISKNGQGRAGVFVGMEYIYQTLEDLRVESPCLWLIFKELRDSRTGLVSTGYQLYFMLLAGCSLFNEFCKRIKEKFYYNQLWNNFGALTFFFQRGSRQNEADIAKYKECKSPMKAAVQAPPEPKKAIQVPNDDANLDPTQKSDKSELERTQESNESDLLLDKTQETSHSSKEKPKESRIPIEN